MINEKDNQEITKAGFRIYQAIGRHNKNFSKEFFLAILLKISSYNEEFKTSLFRLIDVLPSLKSSKAVASHISEYLYPPAKKINLAFAYLFQIPATIRPLSWLAHKILNLSVKTISSFYITDKRKLKKLINKINQQRMTYTVDLLGEYTISERQALDYQQEYLNLLDNFKSISNSKYPRQHTGLRQSANISIKLTALYSQCSVLNLDRSIKVLTERLEPILTKAQNLDCGIYFDAEDQKYNQIIYKTFMNVFSGEKFRDFHLPGVVVQAYHKNSEKTLNQLIDFASTQNKRIAIRLVKGAYWDHEKNIAALANSNFSLFEYKYQTDANYEKLSSLMLANSQYIYSAFASHNVRSLLTAIQLAKKNNLTNAEFELQVLYGMARRIALAFRDEGYLVRQYLPVGELIPGMGYLVRRLLENTANDSFLRQSFHEEKDIVKLMMDPKTKL